MLKRRRVLRPAGFDDLGLRRVLGDRLLPLLVASMAFLAALALAGAVAASALSRHWANGAAAALTVQVPDGGKAAEPGGPVRVERVLAALRGTPGVASARALDERELSDLLRPWLGSDAAQLALPLPAVIEVHLAEGGADVPGLADRLRAAAPGTLLESHGVWVDRLTLLARSLQACSGLALLLVALVAAAVIAVATRAGLQTRREAIELVHGLGATDGYIAGRFASRATRLAGLGGVVGAAAALPVLLAMASLAQPFMAAPDAAFTAAGLLSVLPPTLWVALPALPAAAALIGFATAQATVRRWLRRLP